MAKTRYFDNGNFQYDLTSVFDTLNGYNGRSGAHNIGFFNHLESNETSEWIEGKWSWSDWKLIPTSKPVIVAPPLVTNFVEFPSANKSVDISTALTGKRQYGSREGTLEFIVTDTGVPWNDRMSEIVNYFDKTEISEPYILLDDESSMYTNPDNGVSYYLYWRYDGSFWVQDWAAFGDGTPGMNLTIGYRLDPYKRRWEPVGSETITYNIHKSL